MRPYSQITNEERHVIQKMLNGGMNRQGMSRYLERNISTIYREICRNSTKGFNAKGANMLSCGRHHTRKVKIENNGILRLIVCSLLMEMNSPEVISFICGIPSLTNQECISRMKRSINGCTAIEKKCWGICSPEDETVKIVRSYTKNVQYALENEGFGNDPQRRITRQRLATWREIFS